MILVTRPRAARPKKRDSISGIGKLFKRIRTSCMPTKEYQELISGVKRIRREADRLRHLVPSLGMSGIVPPIPQNDLMACTGSTLPSPLQ